MQESEHRPTARVLNILELLATNSDGLTLTEISQAIGAPKSSIFPVIRTMAQRKFIFSDKNTSKYTIGVAAFSAGSSYTSDMNVLQFIQIEMKYVVKKSGEICQLGILDRDMVLYVAKADSDEAIRLVSYVGKRLPLYCTAIGKILISRKSISEIKALYPDGLKSYTKNTITDFNVLEKTLIEIRETNIAYEQEEITEHIHCISVPLFKGDDIVAGLSVSIPSFRMGPQKSELIKSLLVETRSKIEAFFRENDIDTNSLTISN
ncbi:IclR family transcriptional regulator [Clostridium lacusfryxellense]|uniref:IclR family transcriptional regulator n=1 Tax=Clostridium lacusfryxellense TaxID=205328 RepID=UPI001C0AFBFB|nr:IclR family transcriptional regulator [Clostridium lacusfryxellense]MBU3113189.1 IclR family transcriptional regulator [Clostridium lacusfryxellense]